LLGATNDGSINPHKVVATVKIKSKLILLAPLSILGMLMIGGLFFAKTVIEDGYQTQISKNLEIQSLGAMLKNSFLQARRHEKDFLLRQDMKYSDRHAAITSEIKQQITNLSDKFNSQYPGGMDEQLKNL
jgi:methyl-accepting chemotaxis protein